MTQPRNIPNQNKWRSLSLLLALCALGCLRAATSQQQEDDEPDEQQRPWNKQFKAARPKDANRPASGPPAMAAENDLVGLTLWRLRAAPPGKDQDRPRLLVQEGKRATAKTTHLKAERVAVSTTFSKDDPVQLSIEAHAEGNHYLYVIDREMYADGTSSEPYLIFPTLRTRGGDNFVTAGKLVDIPAATDNSPFQLQQPAAKCCWRKTVEKWERDWVGESEKPREASRLAGQECTAEEKASAIEPQRLLTQGDPLPQTIFRVNDKSAGPLLIVVPLRVNP